MKIAYKNIILRKIEPEDASFLAAMTREKNIQHFTGLARSYSEEECRKIIGGFLEDSNRLPLIIVDNTSHEAVGDITLLDVDQQNSAALVRIALSRADFYGKGYARNAMEALLNYAFSEGGINRVELEVYPFNDRAIQLYRKLGFVEEGRKRQAYRDVEGVFHDVIVMSFLAADWKSVTN